MRTSIFISVLLITQTTIAQSVVVSGSRNSIIVSGKSVASALVPVIETPVVQQQKASQKSAKTCSCGAQCSCGCNSGLVCKCEQKTSSATTERFLISESWCGLCPEAKLRFAASGGNPNNILTMAEASRRHGVNHNPPFEYTASSFGSFQPPASAQTRVTEQGRYYSYGGRRYDLEGYGGCSMRNCGMCAEIRAAQQRYRQSKVLINKVGPQASSPDDVVVEALSLMNLKPESVFCDLGCGDGSVMIKATQRSGCRCVGVEIDPVKVGEARRKIAGLGLSHRITVLEGDVRGFKTAHHQVTHVYAYLYPELLEEIKEELKSIPVVVCPGHECPGIGMKLVGQCWVRRNDS